MKHKLTNLAIGVLALTLAACGGSSNSNPTYIPPPPPEPPPPGEWTLVWEDNFEDGIIDPEKWSHEVNCTGGGNDELQCYTDRPENSYVENDQLHIVARAETWRGPGRVDDDPAYNPNDVSVTKSYTSARLRTKNKGDWKYGRMEIRAKMPEGQGMWPAIWMMPTESVYGIWPLSGEIDIFEAVNINAEGGNEIHGTLHYGRVWPGHVNSGKAFTPEINIWEEFHTYAIEWEEGTIRWYVDDTHFATQSQDGWFNYYWDGQEKGFQLSEGAAPFDQKFHLILNVAVGGQWPGNPAPETEFPQTMVVDSVRVYECSVNPETGRGCAANIMPDAKVNGISGERRTFSLYENGPRTLQLRAYRLPISNTLETGVEQAAPGNIVVNPALDVNDSTVWDVQFNGPGNVFLSSGDMTEVDYVEDGFILLGMSSTGELKFDLRILDVEESTELQVKLGAGYRTIELPDDDEWTTVSVRFSDFLPANAVDYNDIIKPFVLEAVGGTAHVQLNNIRINCLAACNMNPKLDGTIPDGVEGIEVWVDEFTEDWPHLAFYNAPGGQQVSHSIVHDVDLEQDVLEFGFGSGYSTMYLQAELGTTQDLTGFANGKITFELKVLAAGGNSAGFDVKFDCVWPCSSNEVRVPMPSQLNEWHRIEISMADLTKDNSGVNLGNVNTPFSFWPVEHQQSGVRFRVADIRWVYE